MSRTAAVVFTLLFALGAQAETERQQKLAAAYPEIGKLFDAYVENGHVRGAAIGIIVDGELVWTRAGGVQSAGGAVVTADTAFRIASMTKSFTAAAILKLRDEKKLDLDDPVAKYIPELAKLSYLTSDSPVITVRHLLTHSAGFPEDNPWGDRQMGQSDATIDAWMKAGIPFSTAPGTALEYSNYGFAILGRIIERVSGQPYDVYVRTKILEPLGMRSSTFHAASVPAERKAAGARWVDGKWVDEPILPHGGAFAAMGGLWTTTRDLARWVTFLMSAYPPRDDPERGPLKRSAAREMQESSRTWFSEARRAAVDAPLRLRAWGYGYGIVASANCRFPHIAWHSGGLPGYGSLMQWLPDRGVGMIFMASKTYDAGGALSSDVFNALWKTGALQPRPPVPSPALLAAQSDVTKLILRWNGEDAARLVADNFFLDRSEENRKKELAGLAETHGTCTMGAIEAENALRGRWRLQCERGSINVHITLAPTTPPRIQFLSADSVLPPTPELRERIELALKPASTDAFVPTFDHPRLKRQLAALDLYWGPCTLADPLGGDGTLHAAMKLACENGNAMIAVELDEATRKIKSAAIIPDGEQPCVP